MQNDCLQGNPCLNTLGSANVIDRWDKRHLIHLILCRLSCHDLIYLPLSSINQILVLDLSLQSLSMHKLHSSLMQDFHLLSHFGLEITSNHGSTATETTLNHEFTMMVKLQKCLKMDLLN